MFRCEYCGYLLPVILGAKHAWAYTKDGEKILVCEKCYIENDLFPDDQTNETKKVKDNE
jgi:hypothetical protein